MKKILIACALVAAMGLTLVGCSNKDDAGSSAPADNSTSTSAPADNSTSTSTPADDSTSTPADDSTSDAGSSSEAE